MLDQRLRTTEAGAGWVSPAYEHKQVRKMIVTLALLVLSLGVVLVRDHQFWFGVDETAGRTTPVQASNAITPAAAAPIPAAKTLAAPAKTAPAATPAPVVKRSLSVEPAVAKPQHHHAATTINSLKVQTSGAVAAANQATETANSWSPVTNAAERVRMTDASLRQPMDSGYPLLAQQMKVEGSVVLQVIIGADGVVQNMRVLSGPTILATAAREAVRNWHFKPYLINGQAVETSATVTVNLTIKVLDNTANTAAQGKFPRTLPPS